MSSPPIIGITTDLADGRHQAGVGYAHAVRRAGGVPVLLPPVPGCAAAHLDLCDGLVLTGGDDPIMERFGCATHRKAKPVHPDRQAYELDLLDLVKTDVPVLGVCLGMQLMCLHAGGRIDQHLPDTLATHADHWDARAHGVSGSLGSGTVHSHHRQAVIDPGRLDVDARAHDGVIEAVRDSDRRFYVGVQWHPERTADPALGAALFEQLVAATS
jgi:putative glutamine amidotransferase